ncbi:MAG: vitamin B12-dependent ribonucleotide reductase, partial [Planctomycetota bacterium]
MSFEFDVENPFTAEQTQSETPVKASDTMGLEIEQFFSTPGVHPFDQLKWEKRSAKIAGDDGQAIFEQDDIEVPTSWSQLATKVVASKYFYGDIESGRRENSAKQLVHRVCKAIAQRGRKDGYFTSNEDAENFYHDLTWLCVNQYGAFNSPVWFNVGLLDVYNVAGSKHNFRWDPQSGKAV